MSGQSNGRFGESVSHFRVLGVRRSYEGHNSLRHGWLYQCDFCSFAGAHQTLLDNQQSFTMASQYPHGYPTGYGPQRSSDAPYNSPPMGQMPISPYGIPSRTRVDAYGRPIVQQGISSRSYPIAHGQSNQYIASPSLDSPVYSPQEMTRGRSSQSTSTSGSIPSPQSSTGGPKE
jgi:hypothetical protein